MTDIQELTTHIRSLFIEVFQTNCQIEGSDITQDEIDAIQEFDVFEVLENLKDIINGLFSFKKECLTSEKAELVKRSEQFEKMLQKLEAEVRGHIRTEHELKLHIETNQSHSEDLKQQNNKQALDIKELQEKLKACKKSAKSKETVEKIAKLEDMLKEKDGIIHKLEKDLGELRTSFSKSDSEKLFSKKSKEKFEEMKFKIGEKAAGLQNLQRLFRDKVKIRDRGHYSRKSANYSDATGNKLVQIKLSSKMVEKKHNRSTSEQVRPKSAKKRPPSR